MIKLKNGKKIEPKPGDEVFCEIHNLRTTWGALDPYQQLAVESGLDTLKELPCLLEPRKE